MPLTAADIYWARAVLRAKTTVSAGHATAVHRYTHWTAEGAEVLKGVASERRGDSDGSRLCPPAPGSSAQSLRGRPALHLAAVLGAGLIPEAVGLSFPRAAVTKCFKPNKGRFTDRHLFSVSCVGVQSGSRQHWLLRLWGPVSAPALAAAALLTVFGFLGLYKHRPSLLHLHVLFSVCTCVLMSPFYKDIGHIGLGPI